MALVAHPDDETLGIGGTLVHYAAEGVETAVVCATAGQSGRYHDHRLGDPGHPGREKLAAIREAELRAAATVLGLREVSFLGYVDGELDQADPREAIGRIVTHVRRFRPHVCVTFAMDGAYGHPDHIAIAQLATAAMVPAADASHEAAGAGAGAASATTDGRLSPHVVSKFYYLAWPAATWAAYQEAFKTLTSTVDGVERRANPWPDWELTTAIDTRAYWPTVWRAVTCHDSQIANYARLSHLSPEHHEGLWGSQTFYRVFSTVNGGRRRESDLFEGLRE